MENATRILAARGRLQSSRNWSSPPSADLRLARAAHEELLWIGMPRVNMHFVGRLGITSSLIGMLLHDREEPVATWSPGEGLVLPPVGRFTTMVLHEVGELPHQHQLHLHEWLDQAVGHTQVISSTTTSLLPKVTAATFIEPLFYRLNTVCLELDPRS